MAYNKTIWKNREVEKPRTFRITENPDGTVTLIPAEGIITELGTPIVADVMNKIEDELEALSGHSEKHRSHVYFGNDLGTANVKAVRIEPELTGNTVGLGVSFINRATNTGPVTIAVNGSPPLRLLSQKGYELPAGALKANIPYTVRGNGTVFTLEGEGGEYGNVTAAQVREGYQFGTEEGLKTGTFKGYSVGESIETTKLSVPGYYPKSTILPGWTTLFVDDAERYYVAVNGKTVNKFLIGSNALVSSHTFTTAIYYTYDKTHLFAYSGITVVKIRVADFAQVWSVTLTEMPGSLVMVGTGDWGYVINNVVKVYSGANGSLLRSRSFADPLYAQIVVRLGRNCVTVNLSGSTTSASRNHVRTVYKNTDWVSLYSANSQPGALTSSDASISILADNMSDLVTFFYTEDSYNTIYGGYVDFRATTVLIVKPDGNYEQVAHYGYQQEGYGGYQDYFGYNPVGLISIRQYGYCINVRNENKIYLDVAPYEVETVGASVYGRFLVYAIHDKVRKRMLAQESTDSKASLYVVNPASIKQWIRDSESVQMVNVFDNAHATSGSGLVIQGNNVYSMYPSQQILP